MARIFNLDESLNGNRQYSFLDSDILSQTKVIYSNFVLNTIRIIRPLIHLYDNLRFLTFLKVDEKVIALPVRWGRGKGKILYAI